MKKYTKFEVAQAFISATKDIMRITHSVPADNGDYLNGYFDGVIAVQKDVIDVLYDYAEEFLNDEKSAETVDDFDEKGDLRIV